MFEPAICVCGRGRQRTALHSALHASMCPDHAHVKPCTFCAQARQSIPSTTRGQQIGAAALPVKQGAKRRSTTDGAAQVCRLQKWVDSTGCTHAGRSRDRRLYSSLLGQSLRFFLVGTWLTYKLIPNSSALILDEQIVQAQEQTKREANERKPHTMQCTRHVWSKARAPPRCVQCCAPVLLECTCMFLPRSLSAKVSKPDAPTNVQQQKHHTCKCRANRRRCSRAREP